MIPPTLGRKDHCGGNVMAAPALHGMSSKICIYLEVEINLPMMYNALDVRSREFSDLQVVSLKKIGIVLRSTYLDR